MLSQIFINSSPWRLMVIR